jgi:hypothetical protein
MKTDKLYDCALFALETLIAYSCINKIFRYGSTTWDDNIKINLKERRLDSFDSGNRPVAALVIKTMNI